MPGNPAYLQQGLMAQGAQGGYMGQPPPQSGYMDRLTDWWRNSLTNQMFVQPAISAATLPGDVYAGRVDPRSDEAIERSADLAGAVTLGAGAVPAKGAELGMGLRAFHGSPHDFDEFSSGHIGRGKGSQFYGHGLYFSDSEDLAKNFRDQASAARGADSGKMYEVDIEAKPQAFLDWHQMVEEQPEAIQAAVSAIRRHLAKAPVGSRASRAAAEDPGTGKSFYEKLTKAIGSEKAAELLKEAGVAGVRYVDDYSLGRDAEGAQSYAVFDDRIISILRKYGLVPPVAAGTAASQEMWDQTPPERRT